MYGLLEGIDSKIYSMTTPKNISSPVLAQSYLRSGMTSYYSGKYGEAKKNFLEGK